MQQPINILLIYYCGWISMTFIRIILRGIHFQQPSPRALHLHPVCSHPQRRNHRLDRSTKRIKALYNNTFGSNHFCNNNNLIGMYFTLDNHAGELTNFKNIITVHRGTNSKEPMGTGECDIMQLLFPRPIIIIGYSGHTFECGILLSKTINKNKYP